MASVCHVNIEQFPRHPYFRTVRFPCSGDNFYCFGKGRFLTLSYRPVWCRSCRKFTLGEDLSTFERIDEQIREYQKWTLIKERDRHIAELNFERQWLVSRKSPPRCLYCFSAEADVLPIGKKVPHPAGEKSWVMAEFEAVFVDPVECERWLLDPEGLPVDRSTINSKDIKRYLYGETE